MTENEEAALKTFSRRLAQGRSCEELLDAFDGLVSSIWEFMAPLIGDVGTRAVFNRALQVTARRLPIMHHIIVREKGLDLSELRRQAKSESCSPSVLLEGLVEMGIGIFRILAELAGDVLTSPLLNRLEGK